MNWIQEMNRLVGPSVGAHYGTKCTSCGGDRVKCMMVAGCLNRVREHVVTKAEAKPDHELGPCWFEEAAPIDRCAWDNFKPSKDLA